MVKISRLQIAAYVCVRISGGSSVFSLKALPPSRAEPTPLADNLLHLLAYLSTVPLWSKLCFDQRGRRDGRSRRTFFGSTPKSLQARRCEISWSRIALPAATRRSLNVVRSLPADLSARYCRASYRPAAARAWHSHLQGTLAGQLRKHLCPVSGFQLIKCGGAQAAATTHFGCRHACLLLLNHRNNLCLGKTALSHMFAPSWLGKIYTKVRDFAGGRNLSTY